MVSRGWTRREVVTFAATGLLAGALRVRGVHAAIPSREPLALLDGLLSADELARARRELAAWRPKTVATDLVWLWRSELWKEVAGGRRIVAVTRWDKAVLFSGLAREAAFAVRQVRLGPALFRTEIGARGADT